MVTTSLWLLLIDWLHTFTFHLVRKQLFALLGSVIRLSSTYHPQSNGGQEKFNKTLIETLRTYVYHRQDNWDEYLLYFEFTYNNNVNPSTVMSPLILSYARSPWGTITVRSLCDFTQRASQHCVDLSHYCCSLSLSSLSHRIQFSFLRCWCLVFDLGRRTSVPTPYYWNTPQSLCYTDPAGDTLVTQALLDQIFCRIWFRITGYIDNPWSRWSRLRPAIQTSHDKYILSD